MQRFETVLATQLVQDLLDQYVLAMDWRRHLAGNDHAFSFHFGFLNLTDKRVEDENNGNQWMRCYRFACNRGAFRLGK